MNTMIPQDKLNKPLPDRTVDWIITVLCAVIMGILCWGFVS